MPAASPDTDERLARLALARSGGIGPVLYFRLLRRFGCGRKALAALPKLAALGRIPGLRPASLDDARVELDRVRAAGAVLLLHGEPDYPEILDQLPDPPPVLTFRGDPAVFRRRGVAIVGARNASANGCMFARRLARALGDAGLAVISGLARGIDAAAHEGALGTDGSTIAVTAAGIDVAYPPENAGLMREIAQAGVVVTERRFGAEPRAQHFPRRNRVIAGLALGVVVVEAAERSGSLMTARLAAELGREVMAVPGTPLDPRHRGTNRLLRDGATLVENAEDVVAALGHGRVWVTPAPAGPEEPPRREGRVAREASPSPRGGDVVRVPQRPPAAAASLAERVVECLAPEPLAIDELVRQCGRPAAEVQRVLLELELEGRVTRHPGNRVSRAGG